MELVYLIIGLAVGLAIGYLFAAKNKSQQNSEIDLQEWEKLKSDLIKSEVIIEQYKTQIHQLNLNLNEEKSKFELSLQKERIRNEESNIELAEARKDLENLNEKLQNQKSEVEQLQDKFKIEFENIANKLLEEKSEKFAQQNKSSLDILLNPLKEKMEEFKTKVEETYIKGTQERSALVEQIKGLTKLNEQMREDANKLTKALKGDSKAQGNWGEVILERVLEKSGLSKGQEYQVQESFTDEHGKRYQPDIVVYLPEQKNIIIDSKVSLTAYERMVSAEDENEIEIQLKAHIRSIKEHMKGLSSKNYQNLYGINSPDFVLMFIPIEPAFSIAVQNDSELFNEALEKNIVLVSSSTLLATLRTVASIWKQEKTTKNTLEIARQAGDLYDKFVGFTDDLLNLGKRIQDAQKTYEDAMNKMVNGTGNLVRRVENIKKLGIQTSKNLNQKLIDRAEE